tara:strand:- start:250 stop:975 length:726 start_codon:yes stop_codon:yes gene_type:complete
LALTQLNAQVGERVVDIGCGAGQTCVQIARAVGPTGSVLGIDLSPVLVDFAQTRTRNARQVEIVKGDAGSFDFRPQTYDALYSRLGVMAFADPALTFSNMAHALKADGRLAFVCWRSFKENELDHLPFYAAAEYLPTEDVQRAVKAAPFSFSDVDYVRAILLEAGFDKTEFTSHDVSVSAGDIDSTLELCLSTGALGSLMRVKPELRKDVEGPVRNALAAREDPRGLFMTAAVWIVAAKLA